MSKYHLPYEDRLHRRCDPKNFALHLPLLTAKQCKKIIRMDALQPRLQAETSSQGIPLGYGMFLIWVKTKDDSYMRSKLRKAIKKNGGSGNTDYTLLSRDISGKGLILMTEYVDQGQDLDSASASES